MCMCEPSLHPKSLTLSTVIMRVRVSIYGFCRDTVQCWVPRGCYHPINIRQTHAGVYPADSGFLKDSMTHHFPLQMSGQNMSSPPHTHTHLPCMIRARNELVTHLAPLCYSSEKPTAEKGLEGLLPNRDQNSGVWVPGQCNFSCLWFFSHLAIG